MTRAALSAVLLSAWVCGCSLGITVCGQDSDCADDALCEPVEHVCVEAEKIAATRDGGGSVYVPHDAGVIPQKDAGMQPPAPPPPPPPKGDAGTPVAPTTAALVVPPAPARPAVAGATSATTWLRTETVFVALQSSRVLTHTTLKVAGVDAAVAPPTSCAVCAGACTCFEVDLRKPPLPALRMDLDLVATGVDPMGLSVGATAVLPVTRVRWSRALGLPVRATPAIGTDGTVYVGTSAGAVLRTGALIAVSPTGAEKWSRPIGRIEASVAVSPASPGPQRIYVGAVDALGGHLYAYDTAGATVAQCMLFPTASLDASPAIITGGAAFYSNGSKALIALRPGASPTCSSTNTGHSVPYPGNLVVAGPAAYLADDTPALRHFDFTGGGGGEWHEKTSGAWPGSLPATFSNSALALASPGKVVGAGKIGAGGTVFQATVGGNVMFDYGFSPLRTMAPAQAPVVGASGAALVGTSAGGISNVTSAAIATSAGDALRTAPVLGQGGRLYALAETGALSEWTVAAAAPALGWTAALDSGPAPAFEASPTLDCTRDANGAAMPGMPGTLYAASRGGTLYAIIVDARGIDTTVAWPKYQRDPRNSGNADGALNEFQCP